MTKAKQAAEVVPVVENAVVEQKLGVIAIEIKSIDTQAREFVLRSAVEIGKRLIEAKSLVAHGSWGEWVEANLPYKQSTANNFMRIASEYTPDSQALANLSYTQAVSLLALPSDDREAFVTENDVENMSSRELQAAIKAKQELEQKLREKEVESEQKKAQFDDWAKTQSEQREALYAQYQSEMELRKQQEEMLTQLRNEQEAAKAAGDGKALAKIKTDLRRSEKAASESQQRIAELEANMEAKVKEREAALEAQAAEKLQLREQELAAQVKQREEEMAKQLAAMEEQLRKNNNTAAISVKFHFESLLATFQQLVDAVKMLENEEQKKGIQERISQLCDQMKDQL